MFVTFKEYCLIIKGSLYRYTENVLNYAAIGLDPIDNADNCEHLDLCHYQT